MILGGDWWAFLCYNNTRCYTGTMERGTSLVWLKVALATAMKVHPCTITLRHDGNVVPECNLGQLDPPYQFEIARKTTIPHQSKKMKGEPQRISVDIGRVTPLPDEGLDHEGHEKPEMPLDGTLAGNGSSASSSGLPPPTGSAAEANLAHLENQQMSEEDSDTKCAVIVRARGQMECQYRAPLVCADLVRHFAMTKKMRAEGFRLYERLDQDQEVRPNKEYFLTWKNQRGGMAGPRESRSVSPTVTFVPSDVSSGGDHDEDARHQLQQLEDLMHRIRQINALQMRGTGEAEGVRSQS